jgi:hypothetical protein
MYSILGGLITFPSLHRWKGSSDAYLYCTDGNDPIMIIFYEHMAFMVSKDIPHSQIVNTLVNYNQLFPEPTKDQHHYFEKISDSIFGNKNEDLIDFLKMTIEIHEELILHKLDLVENFISDGSKSVNEEVEQIENIDQLRAMLVEAKSKLLSHQYKKQVANIRKFRISKGAKNDNQEAAEATDGD